ncbi:hypothetical protein GGH91_000604 [Coemansia sp. RSA 2671]|nr:hypothetical protein IWW57_001445 [Coemansia sp. S610]KAJ2349786.1 hypothetical protein GGH91_000604 [Coemansia sp. RSA 2671]KAJ2387259.1 hypothetical protein H4S02_003448 [Coemansia sp. RSA 2611]
MPASKEPADIPLAPGDWDYIEEGTENVIISYHGSEPELQGWVLRLTKCDASAEIDLESHEALLFRDKELQRKQDALEFAARVIGPIVGDKYVLPQRLAKTSAEFLIQVRENIESQRPRNRLSKFIDARQSASLLTKEMISRTPADSTQGAHAVTVELKPKCMALPRSKFLAPESSVKHRVCWYCRHQYTLHKDGNVSQFCPLELFSGDRERIATALEHFAQSPHNNFVVFVDGRSVVDEEGKLSDKCVPHWSELRDAVAGIVQKESLFSRLQLIQRELDSFNIESVLPMYQHALETGALATEEPRIDAWLNAYSEFRRRLDSGSSDLSAVSDCQAVLELMLATTLRDVSVLIKFDSWPARGETGTGTLKHSNYSIGIVDHDPKKVSNIPKYYRLDQNIVATYLQHNPDEAYQRPCRE